MTKRKPSLECVFLLISICRNKLQGKKPSFKKIKNWFSDISNNADLPFEITGNMQLSEIMAFKHATYLILSDETNLLLSINLEERKGKVLFWMTAMINFEKSSLNIKAQNIGLARNVWTKRSIRT